MISTSKNHMLLKDSSVYNKDPDDNLMLLLKCALPSSEAPSTSYAYIYQPERFSFEDPFDDPSLEPLPLKSQDQAAPFVYSSYERPMSYMRDDDCLSSSSLKLDEVEPRTVSNLCQSLIGILDPIMDHVGSNKRSQGEIFSSQGPCKRQRTNHMVLQDAFSDEERMARFRPYQEKQWRAQFNKLIQYQQKNGHCCVPHSYPEDNILARWVKRQRYQYKKLNDRDPTSTMTYRRMQELESIGFVWHSHAAAWQEKLNELKAFKLRNGHCNVPSHHPENPALTTWVKCQRRQYKLYVTGASSVMTMERFQVLESLGFVFELQNCIKNELVLHTSASALRAH